MPLIFLMPIFKVRRYDGKYLIYAQIYPIQTKFTVLINISAGSRQKQINLFLAHTGILKPYLNLKEKKFLTKI